MTLHLTPVSRLRTHEEVVRQLQEEIYQGRLRSGDRLPGERQLGEMLGVSRATVREALRVLEALEIVRVNRGSGRGAGSVIVTEPGGAMTRLLGAHLALSHFSMEDVVETRIAVEVSAVALAAQRADPEHVEGLASVLARMADTELGPGDFYELDTAFHVAIADASGNRLLSYLMQAIRDVVRTEMLGSLDRVTDWAETSALLRTEHEAILAAIRAGDAPRAAALIRRHIEDSPQRRHLERSPAR